MQRTILHLVETGGPGGAERMLVSLVERLEPTRYRSVVCLPRAGWLQTELSKRGFNTVVLPQRGIFALRWLSGVVRLIRHHRVSVMHAHEFSMNTYGTLISALTGTPLISTVHGKNYYPDRGRRRAAYRWVAKRSLMVTVSEDLKRFLCRRVGLGERDVLTVHNGIDVDAYCPLNGAGDKVRNELGLGGQRVVGTIGNLYPVKGHRYLLEAAARVTKAIPDVVFVIAGRGDLLAELQQSAQALGIERRVRFLGYRADTPALLQAMDVFALPSLSEGLPLSLLEAMGAGKPVVATRVGGIPEVIADGDCGLLVPPENSDALADRIIQLLRDPERAARLGCRARQRIQQQFNIASMVRTYEDLYARCAGGTS